MDATTQIAQIQRFLETHFQTQLLERIRKGYSSLAVEFDMLAQFDPELAEMLLDEPENTLKAFEIAVEQLEGVPNFIVRFKDLPGSQEIPVRNIRAKHLEKFIQLKGIVRQKTDVRPQVTAARFECPTCGGITAVLQLDAKFREPDRCASPGCERKSKFRLLSKELVDAQKIVLEEAPDELDGGEQPKRLNIFLKKDLVAPITDKRTNPGSKVSLTGYIKEVPIQLPQGGQSIRYDLILDSNYIEPVEEDYSQINISQEEEEEILELSRKDNIFELLVESLAPSIYGHEKIKYAVVLQLLGGVKKKRSDGVTTRGDLHVLLVGDPGSGKSALLKRTQEVAPKSRFVSGKGTSGAGLTASVVRDEFMRGWALEGGAMVLANKGFLMVDELDKMSPEDRSAFHEALEQQCYHYDTELMLADGTVRPMGELVERLFAEKPDAIIQGKDCEILPTDEVEVLSTDFSSVFPQRIHNVSRHKAPERFVKITFSNGRSITVTPEHPVFAFKDGMITVPASDVEAGMVVPAPRKMSFLESSESLEQVTLNNKNKPVSFPEHIDGGFAKLIGYFASEGHSYHSPENSYAEIGVSNTQNWICEEVERCLVATFETTINTNIRDAKGNEKATKQLVTKRCCSVPVHAFMQKNFPELMLKAPQKRLGNRIRAASLGVKCLALRSAFSGDGFVSDTRCGYCTSSFDLAKDYQDLLLNFSIYSYITHEDYGSPCYKVVLSGSESLERFSHLLDRADPRYERVCGLSAVSARKNNDRDIIPHGLVKQLDALLRHFHVSDGYFYKILKKEQNCHRKTFEKYLRKVETKAAQTGEKIGQVGRLRECLDSDLRFITVKSVETIENTDQEWVYDVQIEPTHAFISEGLVLHNTVTISKANIQATLRCETVVLAAANPKFSRFDPYELLAKQIDLPASLINRFDLIFPVRDLPGREKDEKLASFILQLHQTGDVQEVPIETQILKKYIAYARSRIYPKLTQNAVDEIQKFYVEMRNSGGEGSEGISAIPISARQLEALVRLTEASARSRLSKKATQDDARRAIDLVMYCLRQLGVDPETGKMDIDRLTTGVTASTRNNVHTLKDIIRELSDMTGSSLIAEEEILEMAKEKGIKEHKAEEILEKLNRMGDIFRPKPGFYSMMK